MSGVLAVSMLTPMLAIAQTGAREGATTTPARAGAFCQRIDQAAPMLVNTLAQRTERLETRKESLTERLANHRKERDNARSEREEIQIDRKEALFDRLESMASTTEQQAAVRTFVEAVQSAITKRNTAIQSAVQTFRTGVDAALAERRADLATAVSAFQRDVNTAVEKAKTSCKGGGNSETVRKQLQTDINAARTKFQNARKEIDKMATARRTLAETRKQAVQNAVETFRKEVEAAGDALKAAVGDSNTATTTSAT